MLIATLVVAIAADPYAASNSKGPTTEQLLEHLSTALLSREDLTSFGDVVYLTAYYELLAGSPRRGLELCLRDPMANGFAGSLLFSALTIVDDRQYKQIQQSCVGTGLEEPLADGFLQWNEVKELNGREPLVCLYPYQTLRLFISYQQLRSTTIEEAEQLHFSTAEDALWFPLLLRHYVRTSSEELDKQTLERLVDRSIAAIAAQEKSDSRFLLNAVYGRRILAQTLDQTGEHFRARDILTQWEGIDWRTHQLTERLNALSDIGELPFAYEWLAEQPSAEPSAQIAVLKKAYASGDDAIVQAVSATVDLDELRGLDIAQYATIPQLNDSLPAPLASSCSTDRQILLLFGRIQLYPTFILLDD